MTNAIRLTIREVAESIYRQFGGALVPEWKLRRVVDDLEKRGTLSVQRVGQYRTISGDDVTMIAGELRRLGWLASSTTQSVDTLTAV